MHAATIATGVSGLVAGAAYIWSVIQKRQVLHATIAATRHLRLLKVDVGDISGSEAGFGR